MMNKKHVLYIVENSSVPADKRVWNEALATKELGYDVTVICPMFNKVQKKTELIEGISIYRHYRPLNGVIK